MLLDPGVGYLVVITFGLLLVQAALPKWSSAAEFRAVLANYRVVPAPLVGAVARLVPALETVTAMLLLPGVTRAWADAAGVTLLLAYAGAIAINLRRGRRDLDCGCAGFAARRRIAAWMAWRNVALAAILAVAGLPWAPRPLAWTDAITVAGGVTVVAILYVAVDRLLADVMPRTAALRGAR